MNRTGHDNTYVNVQNDILLNTKRIAKGVRSFLHLPLDLVVPTYNKNLYF